MHKEHSRHCVCGVDCPTGLITPYSILSHHGHKLTTQFVQCLANPLYLYELHTQKYFADEAFINYLEYLQYWHEPAYVRFITYPTCLVYLSLLLRPAFREAVANPAYVSELMRVGARHHETWYVAVR
jgi:mediator of RNA polymerase II transcription subunit 31